jgi:uncharacterized protein YcfJ
MGATWLRRCGAAIASLGLSLALGSATNVDARVAEPTPPETQRLLRIGPVASVCEDEHGNVTMAEEPAPEQPSSLRSFGGLFGAVMGGALGTLGNDPGRVTVGATYGAVAGFADPPAPVPVQDRSAAIVPTCGPG